MCVICVQLRTSAACYNVQAQSRLQPREICSSFRGVEREDACDSDVEKGIVQEAEKKKVSVGHYCRCACWCQKEKPTKK